MSASSKPIRGGKLPQLAVLLAVLMITPQLATVITQPSHLGDSFRADASDEIELNLYTLYLLRQIPLQVVTGT